MAENRIQYVIGFDADVSQAKKEIENLVSSLQKVSKMSLETPIKDSSIKAASDAARELQKHLQAAVDVNTGKLNLNTFSNSLKNANMSVSQLGASLLEAGEGGKTAFMQLANSIANAEVPIKRMNSTLSKWGTTLKNTIKWEISSNAIHGLESALSGAVSYVKNLNSSLNDIRIVTGYTANDMTQFAQQANRAAKSLSTTTKAYADASLIYFQQGDNADLVAKKAAITTKAANVAFSASAEEMSEMLTAVWNSYQVGEEELEKYVDIMAALGATTATSTEEIATAMQKVAATANTVGVSMQQMSSIIATVSSVTREAPESIGTSFKTILARIGDLKLGKSLEDGTTLGTVSSQLKAIGVNVLDANGNLNDMGDILESLMAKWNTLTDAQKTATAQVVAGKRQYTQLMALMENPEMYQKSMKIANNADGELSKQADIFAESWEGASKRVQAAMEEVYSQLINDKALVSLLKFSENFVNTLSGAIKAFGGLGGIIANVGGLLGQYFSADIAAGLIKGITNVKKLFTDFGKQQTIFLENQKSFRDEITKLTSNELLTEGEQNQLIALQKVSEAKSALLEKSKFLTEEQRTAVDGVISAYQKQIEVLRQVQAQYDSLQKSAKDSETSLVDQVMLEESRNVARKDKRNYFSGNNKQRHKDWLQAGKNIVTDTDIEIEVKTKGGKETKKIINNVSEALRELKLTSKGINKNLTFEDVVSSTKNYTVALGGVRSALDQIKKISNSEEGMINLFAAGSSTLEGAKADLQNIYNEYVAIVKQIGEKPIQLSFDGNLTREQLEKQAREIEKALSNLGRQINTKTQLIQSILSQMVPPELKSQFEELFRKWNEIGQKGLNTSNTLKEAWKQAAKEMTDAIDKAVSKSQQKLQNLTKVAFALTQLVASINSIKNALKTFSDPDASGWEKFGAAVTIVASALMSVQSAATALAPIKGLLDVLTERGAKAQAAEAAATATNTVAANGLSAVFSRLIVKVKLLAAGFRDLWAKALAPALTAAAPFIAIAAIIAGITVAIINAANAEKKWQDAAQERVDKINKNIGKEKESSKKLGQDVRDLATIMNDTTMAYDQQIEKINEIAKAYGIQASSIDGLTDSYANLKNKLSGAMSAEAQKLAADAAKNAADEQSASDDQIQHITDNFSQDRSIQRNIKQIDMNDFFFGGKVDQPFDYFSYDEIKELVNSGKYENESEAYQILKQLINEEKVTGLRNTGEAGYYESLANLLLNVTPDQAAAITSRQLYGAGIQQYGTKESSQYSLFNKLNKANNTQGKVSLIGSEVWTDNNFSADGNIQGILEKKLLSTPQAYNTDEGRLFTNENAQKLFASYGFYFDKDTAQFQSIAGAIQDYIGLFNFLTTSSQFSSFVNDENSFTYGLIQAMKDASIDDVSVAQQEAASAQAKANLWKESKFQDNLFSTKQQSIKDVLSLVGATTANVSQDYRSGAISDVLSYLSSNFSNYKNSSDIVNQELQIANQVIANEATKPGEIFSPKQITDMQGKILSMLYREFGEIDLSTVLKISPSDIEIVGGQAQLKEGVKDYIEKAGQLSNIQTKQQLLKDNTDFLTKDTFDRADIDTITQLIEQGVLGNDVDAATLVKMSKPARIAMIQRLKNENNQNELSLLPSVKSRAEERQKELQGEFDTARKTYDANHDTSYIEQKERKAILTTQNSNIQTAYDEYNSSSTDQQKDYDWADLLTSLGAELDDNVDTKGAAGKKLVDDIFSKNNKELGIIQSLIGYLEMLDDNAAMARTTVQELENDMTESQYQQWLDKVEKSTNKANNSTKALGKRGELTAEELANLAAEYGEDVYSNYQNMSDYDWDTYVYENAMKAYDELYILRAGDLAAQAEILQQKKQAEAEYWAATSDMRNKDYNEQMKQYEKNLELQKSATEAMQNSLTTGQVTSSQQQAIAKGEYNWQFGNSQEVMRSRLSAYGAGLLNQTMAQLNINNAKKGQDLLSVLFPDSNFDGDMKQRRSEIIYERRKQGLVEALSKGEAGLDAYFAELSKAGIKIDSATENMLREMAKNSGDYAGLTFEQIYEKYKQMNTDIDSDNDELWANFEDSAITAIASVIDSEKEAAEEVFSVWESTYKAIAQARLGLASGQSIAKSMLGDVDSQALLIKNLLLQNPNMTNEEVRKALYATSETEAGALVTPTKLSMEEYGASRGIGSAILTGEEAEWFNRFHETNYKAGDILASKADYLTITGKRLSDQESAFKQELSQNEETKAAYIKWLKDNGKDSSDYLSSDIILKYLRQREALDGTKIAETFANERGYAIGYENNYQAQNITDAYGRAKTAYDTTYKEESQRLSDWQAIYEASLQSDKGTISEVLGDKAAEIAARLGYKDVKDLDMISSDEALTQISSASQNIDSAQATFNKAIVTINGEYGEDAVASTLGETLVDDYETISANTAAAASQAEAITNGQVALEAYANSLGVSENELKAFTQDLIDNGKIVGGNAEQQIKAAAAVMRQNRGYTTIQSSLKGYMKELAKTTKGSKAYYSVIENIRSIYGDVFDLTKQGMSNLSTSLLENADNAKLLEKAAKGDSAAFDKLQSIVAKDLTQDIKVNIDKSELDALIDEIAAYDFGNIKIGTELDDAPFYNKLKEMTLRSKESADAMSEALSSMGVDATLIKHEVLSDGTTRYWNTKGQMVDADGNLIDIAAQAEMSSSPVAETYWTIQGAKYNGKGVSTSTANKSSGGGGGGGKPKKLDKKKPEDEKERYHHVNKTLDRLSNQLDEIDKKKSRVYGKGYLDYISQEIALTEKQCDTYQRYIDEAKEYLSLDTQRVASLGAVFDEFGNIENYDQVMDNIIGKYNEFVDRYNAMSASEQEQAEEEKTKWDEWYEEKKKWIENYEETVSTIYEQQNNLLEAQNKISEKTLEGIQYKVEIHVDITDAEKDFLDYLNDTYDELLEKQGDVMNNLVRETELATSNLDALGRSKEELDAAFASGKLNQTDYIEGLKDVNEQILDNLNNIQDLKKEIEELYGDTLEMASDAFDEQTEKVKNASEAMSSYISILGLIGKGSNLKDLTKFYESQYEYNLQSLEMQKEYLDILRSEEQYYLERMNSAEGLTETERQQYEDLEKTIADVNSNILSDTESTLNQITEAFNNEIEIIFKDLEERIAGVGNSVQDLADAYSYYQEEQSRYVTSARELYEVNKLNRQIEKTMNETSSKVNKNLLAALQDRINKQSELNELTEYDIEMNQLQYELLLKKIALEEAQNAKSTVRLTRDSGGNYVYQYTADQDDIMTKQQEYEDVLQKINDLAVNRVQDLESQLLEIYQNTLSKIKEIAQDQTLTEEEKYDKIQTIMNQFKEQTNFIQEQYKIASDNLITSNLAISEHYGQQLVEHSENAKNGLNQTIAAMIENTEELQQALENACANQIPAAMDTMQSRIDAVTAAVNLNYNSMSNSVTNYNKVTKDAQDQTSKTANSLNKDLLPAIHSATAAWDTYMGKLKNVISIYESMYQSILKTIQAQAKLSDATAPSTVKSSGTGKFSDTTTPSASGSTGADSGGGGDKGNSNPAGPRKSYTPFKTWQLALSTDGGKTFSKIKTVSSNFETVDPIANANFGAWQTGRALKYRRYLENGWGNWYTHYKYLEGGLADFTGPAWLDGSKSRPEMVLNAKDTENILTAVQGVRALDASTLSMLNKYITNASLAMSFGLGNISAGSVYGATDTIQQEVHITAEFPNATNSAEIQDAFDNIINRATQYITTKR